MRYFLIFICLLAIPTFLLSQIDSFDIARYARPDLVRETAGVVPDFSLSTRGGTDDFQFRNKGIGFNFGGDFYKSVFVNTATTQLSSNYRLGLNVSLSNFENDLLNSTETRKYFNLSPNFTVTRSKKIFKDTTRFFEYDIIGNIDFDVLNFDDRFDENISRELINGTVSLPLYWGKGRIENVNAAWLSNSIFKMLGKADLLEKEIGQEEILALADKLASFRTIRNTDFRLEQIAVYESLCEHFISNGLVDGNDYRFFGNLNDAYLRESFVTRNSGKEIKFGIIPNLSTQSLGDGTSSSNFDFNNYSLNVLNFSFYSFNYFNNFFYNPFYFSSSSIYTGSFSDENTQLYTGSAFLTFSYSNYRPTSLNWQKDFQVQVSTGPRINKVIGETEGFNNFERTQIIANIIANYNISFIPNQRSNYTINFNLNYLLTHDPDTVLPNKTSDNLRASINGQYLKYVSPQVAWFVRGSLDLDVKAVSNTGFFNSNNIRFGIDYRLY